MVQGIVFSMLAGIMISLQGIFNSRVSEKIGMWHTNTIVHGSGFILAFIILMGIGKINFNQVKNVNPMYLIGGFMGVVIVFSVMKGIINIGASYSVTIILITQIMITALINYFGFFGESTISLSTTKFVGLLLMISGILLYQLTG